MKKRIFLIALALVVSAGVFAQETVPVQKKTRKQTRTEVREQVQDQSGDPIMERARVREQVQAEDQSGDPIMKQTRKQDHKAAASGARQGQMGRQQSGLNSQAGSKARINSNAGAKRPATVPGKGAGRR
ncbi:MAG: hypothetical protein JXR67_04520 [Bacteroidales bacterium]|nr:hypothetical protein [Bacteroidales bacterium]